MDIGFGSPFKGKEKERVRKFLGRFHLDYEEEIEFTVNVLEQGEIVATGSRQRNVFKCIAVSPELRGQNLSAIILTELQKEAVAQNIDHLFIFTTPENERIFLSLGFYNVAKTAEALLMENRKNGIRDYIGRLACPSARGKIGCVIGNCNPFTNGHLYLVESAAKSCDWLHLFILSENQGMFPAVQRLALAKKCTSHLKNVVVHPTEDYLISFATFPTYFIREKADAERINCTLDLVIFGGIVAKALNITMRFVGTEPFDRVTEYYNRRMKEVLPEYGIQVIETPRCICAGETVSASLVRRLIADQNFAMLRPLVPPATYAYILQNYGRVTS